MARNLQFIAVWTSAAIDVCTSVKLILNPVILKTFWFLQYRLETCVDFKLTLFIHREDIVLYIYGADNIMDCCKAVIQELSYSA